jgi:hypothetical protein
MLAGCYSQRALETVIGKSAAPEEAVKTATAPMLSFLDQIKAGKAKSTRLADATGTSLVILSVELDLHLCH